MATFGLVKSFNIDHGELDGLRPQECFVLGYELAMVDHLLESGDAIERPVHPANRERIADSCKRAGRRFTLTWTPDDVSESWIELSVEPKP